MRWTYKIITISVACLTLAACASIQNGYNKTREEFCKNKDVLIAAALAANDMRAVNAIDAYCAPLPVKGL